MARILIIEDDPALLMGLADNLRDEGYVVECAASGEAGLAGARRKEPDIVILDLMLPGISGYEVCSTLRKEGADCMIMMLTARGDEADRVVGLDLGADDYLTKPFSLREFLARVRAMLRRTESRDKGLLQELSFADVRVDFRRFEASCGGEPVHLTRKEFGVLQIIASSAGEVVPRERLLEEVWGYDRFPSTRTVDNHVAALRAKLERDPASPDHLLTVHGVGYKWAL